MLRNYLKIALRQLARNRAYSFINIGGLAAGMAVAMLIGLWVYDELSFNTYHENYARIAQVRSREFGEHGVGINLWPPPGTPDACFRRGRAKFRARGFLWTRKRPKCLL